jgi:Ca-activated chloride channel family protein
MKTDDPKFTAYCLGELDPAERAEIEALLDADPEMAAEVEETKIFAAQLRAELVNEKEEGLDEARRADVMRVGAGLRENQGAITAAAASSPHVASRWGTWMLRMAALIALLALVGGLFFSSSSRRQAQSGTRTLALGRTIHPTDGHDGDSVSVNDFGLADADPATSYTGYLAKAAKDPAREEAAKNAAIVVPGLNQSVNEGIAFEKEAMVLAQLNEPKQRIDLAAKPDDALPAKRHDLPAPATEPQDVALDVRRTAAAKPPATPATLATAAPESSTGSTAVSGVLALNKANAPRPTNPTTRGRAVMLQTEKKEVQDTSKLSIITDNETLVRRKVAPEVEAGVGGAPIQFFDAAALGSRRLASSSDEARKQLDELDSALKDGTRWREQPGSMRGFRAPSEPANTEAYDVVNDNPFMDVRGNPVSTFSIDVDSASYANVRRFLNAGERPPKGAVRIEELLNYFNYDYPQPKDGQAFSATLEAGPCPWTPEHRLVRVGLKGREVKRDQRPATNLVFLVDVSGSMQPANKLPLVKESLRLLVDQLTAEDRVSIAVYAGASGCVLQPTSDKAAVRAALEKLEAGGSTNGASGIQLAYELAQRAFIQGGVNRVILATDGDFNVGVTSQSALIDLIESKAKSGVFLSVLGFGMGNLKDSTLEKLADKGNGNYAYIDTLNEGRKVLVEQMSGTLVTIAKDVKIQVEFNPAQVTAYRLIGYENRLLAKEDFNDDTKDAGEIGAGHSVTALYEVVPAGQQPPPRAVDALKYQTLPSPAPAQNAASDALSREMLTLKLRHKLPDGDKSQLLELPLVDEGAAREKTSRDFRFAAAVASFGMLLRDSPHKGSANWDTTLELAVEGKGDDASGYRGEFISLINKAKTIEQARSGPVPVVAPSRSR